MKNEIEIEYATFWQRLGALIIDLVIINVVLRLLLPKYHDRLPKLTHRFNWLFDFSFSLLGIFNLVAECGYFVYCWSNNRQTIGQKVFGIKTIRKDGEALSYTDSIIRFIGYIISGSLLGIGYLWILIDDDKQGLHDKMSSTIVIKCKKASIVKDTVEA